MTYALVIYTRLLPERKAGLAIGPLVLIQRRYKGDAGLLAHELEHVRQFWVTFGLHLIFYPFSRHYRLWAEAVAFARQVRPDRSDLDAMAERLARASYRLNITRYEARRMIERYL